MYRFNNKIKSLLALTLASPLALIAQETATAAVATSTESGGDNTKYLLAGFSLMLLFIIIYLGRILRISLDLYAKTSKDGNKIVAILVLLAVPSLMQAGAFSSWKFDFQETLLIFTIIIEFIVIAFITKMILGLTTSVSTEKVASDKPSKFEAFFQGLGRKQTAEEETKIDLKHDYDGISELDNKVPAWWTVAFLISILSGVIYLYRMYGSETMPSQYTELKQANMEAEMQIAQYLNATGGGVDEKNVVLLDKSGIESGKSIFDKNCVACHGDKGQGNAVGPNLTDDYWLHGGDIKDVFYSVKYGWAAKGMKSWKEDFSGKQIAEISSYIMSIHGTNPPGAKAPQGELYTAASDAAPVTGTATPADTTKVDTTHLSNK